MKVRKVNALIAAASIAAAASAVQADAVADFKGNAGDPSTTYPINSTPGPVVTYILTKTASYESFLIQDSTGALEVYKDTFTNNTISTYVPAVGDTINLKAFSYDYYGLYEAESSAFNTSNSSSPLYSTDAALTLSVVKTGTAALPAPVVFTVAGMQNGSSAAPTLALSQQSELGNLYQIYFVSNGGSGAANGTGGKFVSNGTYDVTDGSGMSAVVYVGSGSPLIGQAIPSVSASLYGYMGEFDFTAGDNVYGSAQNSSGFELDPLSITVVPEPVSMAGFALAGLTLVRRRRTS